MTTHKLIVFSMLAVTTVLALRYVSTFSVAEDYARTGDANLEAEKPRPASSTDTSSSPRRTVALRHLA